MNPAPDLVVPTSTRNPAELHGPHRRSTSALVRLALGVASFETLFLLYLFAGHYKHMNELSWIPVDLTGLLFVISGAAAFFLTSSRINITSTLEDPAIVLFLLFIAWSTLTILWSSFDQFNVLKALHTATLLSWSFLGAYLFISYDWHRTRVFIMGLMILSAFLLLYWNFYRFVLGVDEGAADVNTYLAFAYHGQYLVAILLALALTRRGAMSLLAVSLGLAMVWGALMFLGGRGPLILSIFAVPIALLILMVNHRWRGFRRRFLTFPLALVAALGTLMLLFFLWTSENMVDRVADQMTTVERLQSYSASGFDDSLGGRIQAQQFALERWLEAPFFGWGIGEFKLLYGVYRYPHNLFIEILMEEGVVGFALLVALASLAVVRAWRLWPTDPTNWMAIALVLLLYLELASRATVQGFLPDERALFAFLGLVLGLGRQPVGQHDRAR
jgi:O-antigen ligase